MRCRQGGFSCEGVDQGIFLDTPSPATPRTYANLATVIREVRIKGDLRSLATEGEGGWR